MHFIADNKLSDYLNRAILNYALNDYFCFYLNEIELPKISWDFTENKAIVIYFFIPKQVNLWTAHNPLERDFCFINKYDKTHLLYKSFIASVYEYWYEPLCDNCYNEKEVELNCYESQECFIETELESVNSG